MSDPVLVSEKFPHGICPFMSGQLAPVAPVGAIQPHGGIAVSSISIPCAGPNCQLWSVSDGMCAFKLIARHLSSLESVGLGMQDVASSLDVFEPPQNGPGPVMRIADALEKMLELRRKVPD